MCNNILRDAYDDRPLLRCDLTDTGHSTCYDKLQNVEWRQPFAGVSIIRLAPVAPPGLTEVTSG